ncbi:MAG: hypothetical protein AB1782_19895 [Cyanobacteriota bacterium]
MNWNIEVSKEMYLVLSRFFSILGFDSPKNITTKDLEQVLAQMEKVIEISKQVAKKHENINKSLVNDYEKLMTATNSVSSPVSDNLKVVNDKLVQTKPSDANILIISKLGVIRYQLKTILSHHNIEVLTCDNLYGGLAEYVKKLYNVVIFDITENISDAVAITREIKRVSCKNASETKVIALASDEKSTLIKDLIGFGIDSVIIKNDNWYDKLLNELEETIKTEIKV